MVALTKRDGAATGQAGFCSPVCAAFGKASGAGPAGGPATRVSQSAPGETRRVPACEPGHSPARFFSNGQSAGMLTLDIAVLQDSETVLSAFRQLKILPSPT